MELLEIIKQILLIISMMITLQDATPTMATTTPAFITPQVSTSVRETDLSYCYDDALIDENCG